MKALVIGCMLIASPANAATAILCNTTTVLDMADSATDPHATKKTMQADSVFVIDDVAKSIMQLNKRTGGYDAICSECKIEFGPSKISALWFPSDKPSRIVHYVFDLDRVKGTVSSDSTNFNMDTGSKYNMAMTGTCAKTAMPKISDAKAKF